MGLSPSIGLSITKDQSLGTFSKVANIPANTSRVFFLLNFLSEPSFQWSERKKPVEAPRARAVEEAENRKLEVLGSFLHDYTVDDVHKSFDKYTVSIQ